jgi:ATP-binding cassette subfamily B (MDR/TAP) protein 1
MINSTNKQEDFAVQVAAFAFGYSKFIENCSVAVILYFGTLIMLNDTALQGENIFLAIFTIIFGAFGAGQASMYGPDAAKAKIPAMKIFKITDTPTQINAVEIPAEAVPVPDDFKGAIEFRDVWFRYPMRPKHWVFKGLNLKINPMDSIAIVGESGQGKSTLILLLMRFYDVNEGEILIDGVNIKNYDIRQLRRRMGLVMQEPTLFNYSVKENVLYGN